MNGWPGEVEHTPTCLDVMTCTCITVAEFNAYDSVCARLAEAVRLLQARHTYNGGCVVPCEKDAPCDVAAFLAKEKEKR